MSAEAEPLSVVCPVCLAQPGQACVGDEEPHRTRKRDAGVPDWDVQPKNRRKKKQST